LFDEKPETAAAPDLDTLTRVRQAKKEADKQQAAWRTEARQAYAFVAGDQWEQADKAALLEQMRAPVVFNRIGPMVESVAGSEVNNRQTIKYIPRQPGDSGVNELLTGAADYIRDNCDAEDEESDAFLDAIVCGIGVCETRLDYTDNSDGDVLIERRDPLSMRWDPTAKKRNLSDRRWHQREEWLDLAEIEAKWPEKAGEIAASSGWGDGMENSQPHDSSPGMDYLKDASGYDQKDGKFRVIHHQWFELETFHEVLDPTTGSLLQLSSDDFKRLNERAQAIGQDFPAVKKQRKVFKQAFVAGDTVLEEGPCPCNRFTYTFITAKRDRNKGIWYGIVRPMVDPQKWANKFFSQVLHIINTNAKGGLLIEEDATDDIRKLKEDWSKADSVVTLNPGAIAAGKIQPKPLPQYPMAIDNMLQFSVSSLRDVTGINLELLGMADRQQAGVLEAQRKQAAMTVLAPLFDSLRRYRKEAGRLLASFIADYLSDGRLVRIVGGDGLERFVPLVRDPTVLDIDVIVDEAPNTVDRKQQTFDILMQMLPTLSNLGIPFAVELLEYSPLPSAMVEKWKQLASQQMVTPQQAQQMQQAIQQLQQQLAQATQRLQSKEQELQQKMAAAQMEANLEQQTAIEKARIEAQAEYEAAIQKAQIEAQALIQKAAIESQAAARVQGIELGDLLNPQEPAPKEPDPQITGALEQLMGALTSVSQMTGELAQRIEQVAQVAQQATEMAARKPKGIRHKRNAEGFIESSEPIWD
jgi:hypothetical protein